jgi:hypothetical protein
VGEGLGVEAAQHSSSLAFCSTFSTLSAIRTPDVHTKFTQVSTCTVVTSVPASSMINVNSMQ